MSTKEAPTIWTAAATDVPALQKIDMRAPITSRDRKRARTSAARLRADIERALLPFGRRTVAASRKTPR